MPSQEAVNIVGTSHTRVVLYIGIVWVYTKVGINYPTNILTIKFRAECNKTITTQSK